MPLNIVLLRPLIRSRLKPYYWSTITSFKVSKPCILGLQNPRNAVFDSISGTWFEGGIRYLGWHAFFRVYSKHWPLSSPRKMSFFTRVFREFCRGTPGILQGYPGHPEVELPLDRLCAHIFVCVTIKTALWAFLGVNEEDGWTTKKRHFRHILVQMFGDNFFYRIGEKRLSSVRTRGIVLSCGIFREQALLRKSKTSRKSPQKWTFLSLAFYNAPSLHTVEKSMLNKNYRSNVGRDYHQGFAQPDFRAENKGPSLEVFCLFSCV